MTVLLSFACLCSHPSSKAVPVTYPQFGFPAQECKISGRFARVSGWRVYTTRFRQLLRAPVEADSSAAIGGSNALASVWLPSGFLAPRAESFLSGTVRSSILAWLTKLMSSRFTTGVGTPRGDGWRCECAEEARVLADCGWGGGFSYKTKIEVSGKRSIGAFVSLKEIQ